AVVQVRGLDRVEVLIPRSATQMGPGLGERQVVKPAHGAGVAGLEATQLQQAGRACRSVDALHGKPSNAPLPLGYSPAAAAERPAGAFAGPARLPLREALASPLPPERACAQGACSRAALRSGGRGRQAPYAACPPHRRAGQGAAESVHAGGRSRRFISLWSRG